MLLKVVFIQPLWRFSSLNGTFLIVLNPNWQEKRILHLCFHHEKLKLYLLKKKLLSLTCFNIVSYSLVAPESSLHSLPKQSTTLLWTDETNLHEHLSNC